MNEILKRHVVSATITFLSTFFVFLGLQMQWNQITPENISASLFISALVAAGRAGVKAVIESY